MIEFNGVDKTLVSSLDFYVLPPFCIFLFWFSKHNGRHKYARDQDKSRQMTTTEKVWKKISDHMTTQIKRTPHANKRKIYVCTNKQ